MSVSNSVTLPEPVRMRAPAADVWFRIASFGSGSEFAIKDLELGSVANVPEGGPGLLVMGAMFAGLLAVHRVKLARVSARFAA